MRTANNHNAVRAKKSMAVPRDKRAGDLFCVICEITDLAQNLSKKYGLNEKNRRLLRIAGLTL